MALNLTLILGIGLGCLEPLVGAWQDCLSDHFCHLVTVIWFCAYEYVDIMSLNTGPGTGILFHFQFLKVLCLKNNNISQHLQLFVSSCIQTKQLHQIKKAYRGSPDTIKKMCNSKSRQLSLQPPIFAYVAIHFRLNHQTLGG